MFDCFLMVIIAFSTEALVPHVVAHCFGRTLHPQCDELEIQHGRVQIDLISQVAQTLVDGARGVDDPELLD